MEILDIINDQDEVIGTISRKEANAQGVMHRIVHVLIFDNFDRMALQLRSDKVDWCPGHWSTAVGGHVLSGETFEQGAKREMLEELGVDIDLEFLFKDLYIVPPERKKLLSVYRAVYEGEFKFEEGKIVDCKYFTLDEIKNMIDRGEKFHPELLFILNKHYFK
jgi:isopentenyldiphosphate isomerase